MEIIKNILIIIGIFFFLSLGVFFLLKSGESKKQKLRQINEATDSINEINQELDDLLEILEEINEPLEQVAGFIDKVNNKIF